MRQPSVSLEKQGLRECAELVRQHLAELGCQETALIDVGDAYPGVWGRLDSGARKTILYYSHYDVRPGRRGALGLAAVRRRARRDATVQACASSAGAPGDQGSAAGMAERVQAIKAVEGKLPVNVLFLIEGAEIMGAAISADRASRIGSS